MLPPRRNHPSDPPVFRPSDDDNQSRPYRKNPVENIAAFTLRPAHEQAIRDGLAHFAGLPLIDLDGDRAVVTSYLMIIHLDHEGRSRELPNHGASQGYRIHRVVVNRWELERRNRRWMIAKRTLLPVDGSEPPLELLRRGLGAIINKAASK